MNRRVLVAGYFYPDSNMGGVRLRRICRLLPRHGWDVVVLTHPVEPGSSGSPAASPPAGVRVEAVAAPDLAAIYRRLKGSRSAPTSKPGGVAGGGGGGTGGAPQAGPALPVVQNIGFTSKINRWLMVPDKYMPWLRPAVRRGRQLLREEKFDAVFASLDPRTALIAATRLSAGSGVPAVIEFRDLWVGNPYYHLTQPTAFHRALHARLERNAVCGAARVSAVCRGIQAHLTQSYGAALRAPVALNYNFFDPDEYPAPSRRDPAGPFVISYAGNLYASRTPHQFFEGLKVFLQRHALTPAQFRFRWAGGVAGVSGLTEVLERTGLQPYIDFLGQLPHRAALQLLVDSDASLLLQAPDDVIHIPGKLFESMGARVPLFALSNPCETADLIRECRAGLVSDYDTEAVAAGLAALYQQRRSRAPWEFNEARRQDYSADAAVARLAALFDDAARTTAVPGASAPRL